MSPSATPSPSVPETAGVVDPATGAHVTSVYSIARVAPERSAVVESSGREATFGELVERAHAYARGLRALGLGAGDCLVLLAPNVLEFLEVYFEALEIGVYVAPANWHLTGPEVGYIIDNSASTVFVASERFGDVAVRARAEAGLDAGRCFAIGEVPGFRPLAELAGPGEGPPDARTAGGPMLYTSGTTGRPKGVRRPVTGASPDVVSVPVRIRVFGSASRAVQTSWSSATICASIALRTSGRFSRTSTRSGPSSIERVCTQTPSTSMAVP